MPRAAETAIGIDVGGTRIRAARLSRAGDMLDRVSLPVRPDRAGFRAQLAALIHRMRDDDSVGVGIGLPGRIEGASGRIVSAGYLDIAGLDLPDLVARQSGLPTRIENDATMALIAESRGRPVAESVMMMVTIGTGIGGAILNDGRPWPGGGIAGQFGHIVVAADGPACKCGRRGCVETFSSGTALGRSIAAAALPGDLIAGTLLDRADAGDPVAAEIVDRWADPLRRALETLVAVADPSAIVIGGGLGAEMVRALDRLPGRGTWFGLPVEAARLGDEAGVIGAALSGFDIGDRPEGKASG